ncbi:MAG: hypothetical protein IK047_04545 [Clostridia bacterium]|nr:hypothetical protein [Clostridia bacterium]
MKKPITIAVLLALALAVLTACSGGSAAKDGLTVCAEVYFGYPHITYSADELEKIAPQFVLDGIASAFDLPEGSGLDAVADAINEYNSKVVEEAYGGEYKTADASGFKAAILRQIKPEDDGFEERLNSYLNHFSGSAVENKIDKEKILAFAEVAVSCVRDGEREDTSVECVNYDGTWYLSDLTDVQLTVAPWF